MTISRRNFCAVALCAAVALGAFAHTALATGVPIGGFLPMVGIGLTDEFFDDFTTFPEHRDGVAGTLLGPGGTPRYDVALLDTGAAVSLLTRQAFNDFGLGSASPGEPDGYRGTETVAIGGATGTLLADINDPFGLYVSGLQHRTGVGPLTMDDAALQGQINTSTITLPAESDLPNVVGLSYASQYATYIRSDQPQIFTLDGKTVRTPTIEFLERGSGGQGITRRAPLSLNPGQSFQQPPGYFPNIENFDLDNPQENPSIPTIIQGGLFLNVNLVNSGNTLSNSSFFFDTGADVSVLSELTALQLGIDVVLDEPDFTVAVIGSGGAKEDVPGYFLDQFTIQALGGSVVANNVPVIVLDVADPSNPANIVPGIVGTNMLAGRNLVIDPNPSLGGGGASPSLYISDPVTNTRNWTSTASSGSWTDAASWNGGVPTVLSVVNLRNVASSSNQGVTLNTNGSAWEANVSGDAIRDEMMLRVQSGATLTTFAGVNVEAFGTLRLEGGSVDAQYVEILGGTLDGVGSIFTGSGPIAGQVENRGGLVSPGLPGANVGVLNIAGRFANSADGHVWMHIGGTTPGTQYDRLVVDGVVSLDGSLDVDVIALGSAYVPQLGHTFSLISADEIGGAFASLDLPTLAAGKMWALAYEPDEVLLKVTIPGDFNGDFTVDGADLDTWSEGFGALFSGASFLDWQRNLGMSVPLVSAVPEPGALALAALGTVMLFRRRSGGLLARG